MEGGAPPAESAPVPVPDASAAPAPAPEAAAPAPEGASACPPSGDCLCPIQGVKQAHSDFIAWLYQPHIALFDNFLIQAEINGVRREYLFYGLFGLLALCLTFCSSTPLLAALITVLYPAFSSASALRDVNQAPRWMVYWTIFGLLTIVDFFFTEVPLYHLLKTLVLVFLYLPQTQGAVFVHSKIIEPAYNLIDTYVMKKFV